MQTWKKITLAAGLAAVAVATAALAAGPARGAFMKQMIDKRVAGAEDAIQATADQRAVIDAAKDHIVATMQQRFAAHKDDRAQWMALLTSDKLETSQIVDAANKHADEIRATAQEIAPDLVKVHDALTPAQRTKLAEYMKSMHGHHGHGPGGGGGFGGPADGPDHP